MAYITNQWLKGDAARSRNHSPVRANIEVRGTTDNWSMENLVVADLHMKKEGGDYQVISLTQSDLASMLPFLVSLSSETTQSQVAFNVLKNLADASLLELLTKSLSSREKVKEAQSET